jgi:hypothetical protein
MKCSVCTVPAYVVFLWGALQIGGSGCTRASIDEEKRIAASISVVEKNADEDDTSRQILLELRRTTLASLRRPTICSARLYRPSDGREMYLCIHWIESKPTPDALRIRWERNHVSRDFRFSSDEVDYNLKCSKRGVVFTANVYFPKEQPDVELVESKDRMTLFLLQNGVPVSDPYPVKEAEWGQSGNEVGVKKRGQDPLIETGKKLSATFPDPKRMQSPTPRLGTPPLFTQHPSCNPAARTHPPFAAFAQLSRFHTMQA